MKRYLPIALSIVITGMTAVGLHLYAQESQPRVVTISAKRFEFTPKQITLKRGEPVTLRVLAEDREHGFYQKDLRIDLVLTRDHPSEVTITPDKAGQFVAICDQFCGWGHRKMKMVVNVE